MILVADLGNSAVKIGLFENGKLVLKETVDVKKIDEIDLEKMINRNELEGAIFSSVVPEKDEDLYARISKVTGHIIKLTYANAGIRIMYKNPAQLGADRIAHAHFVKHYVKVDSIVIDIGTALTVDAILGDGTFLGGAILAAPATILEALVSRTSRLKRIELDLWPSSFIGNSTEECLKIGLLHGTVGAISHIAKNIEMEKGRVFKKLLTGRGGKFFEEKLIDFHYNPDLNLYGLFAAFNDIKRR